MNFSKPTWANPFQQISANPFQYIVVASCLYGLWYILGEKEAKIEGSKFGKRISAAPFPLFAVALSWETECWAFRSFLPMFLKKRIRALRFLSKMNPSHPYITIFYKHCTIYIIPRLSYFPPKNFTQTCSLLFTLTDHSVIRINSPYYYITKLILNNVFSLL